MSRPIFLFVLAFAIACSTKQNSETAEESLKQNGETVEELLAIDSNPGIQDVVLGTDISKFKDRIQHQDSMVTSKDAMMYNIKLKTPIGENCKGWDNDLVKAFTYRGKIMIITIPQIYCDRLKDLFITKFGQPTRTIGDNYSWNGANCELTFKNVGSFGSRPAYEISFVDKKIHSDYQKSAKGNI